MGSTNAVAAIRATYRKQPSSAVDGLLDRAAARLSVAETEHDVAGRFRLLVRVAVEREPRLAEYGTEVLALAQPLETLS